jgi:hypothetical protein
VSICHNGKYPSLTVSSLEKLDEPPALTQLSSRVKQLLPPVDLTELLLEIDARTGFTVSLRTSVNQKPEQRIFTSACVPFCWPRPVISGMSH